MLFGIKRNEKHTINKELVIINKLSFYLGRKYSAMVDLVSKGKESAIYIHNRDFDVAMTICDTPYGKRIKIEDFIISKESRNKKLGTEIINEITSFCKKEECIVGLWCERQNLKAYNFYLNNGFKHITTKDDYWLEYI